MPERATRSTYAGLFLVTLATLMLQILLTRIFSVTMWYHFAFMAVSVAMFGLTVGAVIVYLRPEAFPPERAPRALTVSGLAFALSTAVCFVLHLYIPNLTGTGSIAPEIISEADGRGGSRLASTLAYLGLTYLVISVPFVFSGIAVCVALTRFPLQVNRLYAADLAGAGLGCALLVALLRVTDAPSAVIVVAATAGLGALFFGLGDRGPDARRWVAAAAVATLALGGAGAFLGLRASQGSPLLRMLWVKGEPNVRPLYEKWNSYAYFRVLGNPDQLTVPFGWGFGEGRVARRVRQLRVAIDATAGTVMTAYSGDFSHLGYLAFDVTNFAHHVRDDARVLVVGSGGGRDVLSALRFDQQSVLAVEINGDLVDALNGRFGSFTGHLDRDPRVTFVKDEARSYIARSDDSFDLIQISLIDTWAATAAGAFVLTENSLYTGEAWELFLERLTPNGLLSVSRFHNPEQPAETYRLTMLAAEALRRLGAEVPRRHVVAVTSLGPGREGDLGVVTLLVSPSPFSPRDLERVRATAAKLGFGLLVDPGSATEPMLERILEARDLPALAASFPFDISPPTDDRPFFFNMLRLRDAFGGEAAKGAANDFNFRAVRILGTLLVIVLVLNLVFVIGPLALTSDRVPADAAPFFLFFAGIGMGFMLVEVSQIQRLIVFLGHPTHGLTVLLFSLLVSSGIGSALTPSIESAAGARRAAWRLASLLALLAAFGAFTPALTEAARGEPTAVRIAFAVAILFPLGLFMGTAFPLGMGLASLRHGPLTPWFWGINGATSVLASVIGVAVALVAGISSAFWLGALCYAAAALAFWYGSRVQPAEGRAMLR